MLLELRDPAAIERALRRDPELHAYELGDLDTFFFLRPSCITLHCATATLLRLRACCAWCAARVPLSHPVGPLPPRFHGHLSTGLDAPLPAGFRSEPPKHLLKMALRGELPAVDEAGVEPLGP